ncbi:MAG: type I-E CRISPR-associated endoribonuclease Cas2e [Hyphomicrobiales bacterium]|jgi:CRISPR-associated protein Cas2|nr:type I-E CRISPR-associated endoribonuclease Cas2e [Hyphomicrobiales bacterium]
MPMVVIITRDVAPRYRGFLGSVMLELSAGVYANPRMNASVRARVWEVLSDWHSELGRGTIVMTWAERAANGGLGLSTLGEAPRDIVAHDAMLLVRRANRAP